MSWMDYRHLRSHQAIHGGPCDGFSRDGEFAVQHFGRGGGPEAGHADEFAAIAEPARPIALHRGFDAYSWNSSEHAGAIFARLLVKQIEAAGTPLARYVAKFAVLTPGADIMWDEIAAAAWIDPSIITHSEVRYMSVDVDHGAAYGNTLTWGVDSSHPKAQKVEIQLDLDAQKFYRMFVGLMTTPTPH